jgi:hypothetical protein
MTVPTITALPDFPVRGEDATTFAEKANDSVAAYPTMVTQMNTMGEFVEDEAAAAEASRIAAEAAETGAEAAQALAEAAADAAEAASGAEQWISGQAYLTGDVVWSPINYLSYRANTNTSGTTDPSASADWTSLNLSLSAANTWTGKQTFSGTTSTLAVVLNDVAEVATVSATAATGTIAYDITTQSVLYYTSNASANWTVNFRASSGTSLNTALGTGQSVTVAFLVTQGATAYYNNVVQVDGTTSGVTTRWIGGAPTAGNASGIDSYRYLIIKTGSATFTVLASVTQFKA